MRSEFKRAFRISMASGMPVSEQLQGKWTRFINKNQRSRIAHPSSQIASVVEPTTTIPKALALPIIKTPPAVEDLECDVILSTAKTQRPNAPFIKKPTRMDRDIAAHRVDKLYELVDQHEQDYIEDLINADCNQPSSKALIKERNTLYSLFGAKPSEREALADLIAKDLSFFDEGAVNVVNGLIKYFEKLAVFIGARQTDLSKNQPGLLAKYKRYGINEIYDLINSISKHTKTGNLQDIKNE